MTETDNNNLPFCATYGSSRPMYRSVAYGTWKVGGARRLSEKTNRRKENLSECTSLDANHNYMSNSHQQPSPSVRYSISAHNLDLATNGSANGPVVTAETIQAQLEKEDCYSSSEYSQYFKQKSQEHLDTVSPLVNVPHRSMDALNDYYVNDSRPFTFDPTNRLYASLGREKKYKCDKPPSVASTGHIGLKSSVSTQNDINSLGQMHKRTHSFDSATRFAIISSPSTSAVNTMKQDKSRKNNGGALRATKNFFKKMTTTLPRKLRKSNTNGGQYADNFQAATSPFFEIRYPEPEEIPYLPYNIEYQLDSETEETVAPDSSISHDEATNYSSTGSRVSDTESVDVSNRHVTPEKFKSWNDLFMHLKKEINLMRERDAEILANLQTVEEGLRTVRHMDRSTSDHTQLGRRIRIGGAAQHSYI